MSEIIYSKKQLAPVINKYSIDPENETFVSIIEMFNGKPNYHVWAVKAVFSGAVTLPEMRFIAQWIDGNQTHIRNLEKQNIVAYKTNKDFASLLAEIRGMNAIVAIKNTVSKFNTLQRKMIDDELHLANITPLAASKDDKIKTWKDLLGKFELLPQYKKENFISLASAYRNINSLFDGIVKSLRESYNWEREDMLAFMRNNTPNCKVVFDKNNVVVLEIPDFESSEKLCGGGRTGWCITRGNNFFENYVEDGTRRKQFFIFNFNKPETDETAHVGFTVEMGRGVVNAHSTKNKNMMKDADEKLIYHGKEMTIDDAFKRFDIKLSEVVNFDRTCDFEWCVDGLLSYLNNNAHTFEVAYKNNNKVCIKVTTFETLEKLIKSTFIGRNTFYPSKTEPVYVFFNFDLPLKDERSMVCMCTTKDIYGEAVFCRGTDSCGTKINETEYLSSVGIMFEDILGKSGIAIDLMLHRYIHMGDEKNAINWINKHPEINVNFEFMGVTPIHAAARAGLASVFAALINNEKIDLTIDDGFGETLLTSLLYLYNSTSVQKSDTLRPKIEKMIKTVLSIDKYDFNAQNINLDTPISVACCFKASNWVVNELLKKGVDLKTVNDYGQSPLNNAMKAKNDDAVTLLLASMGDTVDATDKAKAKLRNIKIKPTESLLDEIYANMAVCTVSAK